MYKNVHNGWLPIDPELLSQLKSSLQQGAYAADRTVLIRELQCDIALFVYCIRELANLLDDEEVGGQPPNPVDLLRQASKEDLLEILGRPPEQISVHRLSETSPMQASCLRQAMIGAHIAELLANVRGVNPELA